jgi:choline-sulfatase
MKKHDKNLIIIMSDEHQGRALGCIGHPFVKTPNLDKLANNGMVFSNAYTSCPICVPARASFATGLPVHKNRLWDNAMPYYGQKPSWGHSLQSRNVPVESIGKLHYRSQEDNDGFDEKHIPMMVVNGVGMVWGSIRRENDRKKVFRDERMLGTYIGPGTSKYTEYDEAVVSKTIKWLENKKKNNATKPWCLYIGLVAPHFPLVVPQKYFDMYPRETLPDIKLDPYRGYKMHPWISKQNELRNSNNQFKNEEEKWAAISAYFGLCSFLDDNIGKIVTSITENGFLDNTTIIYTSDHGDNVGARGLWGKSNFYEESCSIPLILSGPGIKKGICKTHVTLMDISETIVDHFSCESPNNGPGESIYKIADATYNNERIAFSEYHASSSISGAYMIRKGRWKYIYYVGFEPELFDLENDPDELSDLSQKSEFIDICNELKRDLYNICDPEVMNKLAFEDQDKMIKSYGGIEAAGNLGATGATPPPN